MNFENVSKFKKYNILFVVCKQSMKFWNNKYGVFLAKYNKQSQKSRKVIVTGDFNLDYAKKYRPDNIPDMHLDDCSDYLGLV